MVDFRENFENLSLKKIDRLAPIVLLLLILALCWKLASMFWWVVAPPQVMQPSSVSPGSQQQQIPNISGFALFYEQGASTSSANDSLPMQLQGVVVSTPARYSSAVIKTGDVADRIVVGQMIGDSSYQLAEVYWDRVILKQSNGATKELKFNGLETLNQPIEALAGGNAGVSNSSTSGSPISVAPLSNSSSDQNFLGQAIQKMNEDREQYMKNMGVNAGSGQGYEVTDQTPSALKTKLGLRAGDRILSLNGQPVGQGQSDVQLLEQAKREGKVKIEIKRGDQVMTIQQSL